MGHARHRQKELAGMFQVVRAVKDKSDQAKDIVVATGTIAKRPTPDRNRRSRVRCRNVSPMR